MSAGELTCNGGQELNSAGNCFNLSVIDFVPTHTLTQGLGGYARGYRCTVHRNPSNVHTPHMYQTQHESLLTQTKELYYCNMQTQMDVIFQLSGSPNTSHFSDPLHCSPCESCLPLRHQCAVWQLSPQMFEKM